MQKNSFDCSVLIVDAHSLTRLSLFHRVTPESDSRDLAALPLSDSSSDTSENEQPGSEQRELESGEKIQEKLKGSHEDIMVKPPKISSLNTRL